MIQPDDIWDWNVGGIIGGEKADQSLIPALSLAAGLLLVDRLAEATKDENKRSQLSKARGHLTLMAEESISAMTLEHTLSLRRDLRTLLHKKLPEGLCLSLMVAAVTGNPVEPFQVKIPTPVKLAALKKFASDLGCPKSWAAEANRAAEEAGRTQNRLRGPLGYLVTALGLGLVVITVPLAVAFAPAGLAGGAAILAGLAALGPGGLVGGLTIMSAVATAGGLTMASGLFVAGSVEHVEARVILLHSLCLAKRRLRPGTPSSAEVRLFEQMLEALTDDENRHLEVDDKGSSSLKDIDRKRKAVKRALKNIEEQKERK